MKRILLPGVIVLVSNWGIFFDLKDDAKVADAKCGKVTIAEMNCQPLMANVDKIILRMAMGVK